MAKKNADPNAELENRIRFETLISDISAHFVKLPSGEVDSEIERALKRILNFFDVDRCGVMEVRENKKFVRLTHACYAEGVEPVPKDINLAELFPWTYEKLIIKGQPARIGRMSELPPEAEQDRRSCLASGVKSFLSIPLFCIQGIRYLLAIQSLRNERAWPKEFIPRLNLLGEIFVNALERRSRDQALSESESRLNLAADSAGAGLWTLDIVTGFLWLTEKTRELFSLPRDGEITFEQFFNAVHPDDREQIRRTVYQAQQSKEETSVEYRIIRPDGSIRWMASSGRIHSGAYEEMNCLMGVSIDITERKQKEESLRFSEARVASAVDVAGLGFYETGDDARVIFLDDRIRALLGVPPDEEPRGREYWLAHIHPEDFPQVFQASKGVREGGLDRFAIEYRYMHPSHGLLWLHHLAHVLKRNADGHATSSVGVIWDITDRKLAEEKLLASQETLRAFTSKLLTIQEEERRRLARELHDDFTQRLAVLAMDMARLELSAKTENAKFTPKLKHIREQIVKLSTDILDVSRQLHPSIIDDLGLGRAIQSECSNFTQRMGIVIDYTQGNISSTINRDISVTLFRITQEALRNIHKHAQVKEAAVSLIGKDDHIILTIQDKGTGFNPDNTRQTHGLGLFSMKERVQLIGGVFSIDTAPGQGTQIKVVVPL
jgi:PAS domain S-box-containing protein